MPPIDVTFMSISNYRNLPIIEMGNIVELFSEYSSIVP